LTTQVLLATSKTTIILLKDFNTQLAFTYLLSNCDGPGTVGPGNDGPGTVGPGNDGPGTVGPGIDGPGNDVTPTSG
jgi:hypothetical protein